MWLSQDISKYNETHEETVHVEKSNYGVPLAWVPSGLRLNAKFIVIRGVVFFF